MGLLQAGGTFTGLGDGASSNQSSSPNQSTAPNQSTIPNNTRFDIAGLGSSTGTGLGVSCLTPTGDPKKTCSDAGNPINVMNGNKFQRDTDMTALPGVMGLEIVRSYNSLELGLGQVGYGWRLSYETELFLVNNTIQIIESDGSRLIFNRDPDNPNACACLDPAQGHVMIYTGDKGKEYTWFKLDGKQLHFNHQGKLERISLATGESTYITRGPSGEMLKVTDPQGRSLHMQYADKHAKGFKGIIAIDSPEGRFEYEHDNDPKSPGFTNLILVRKPAGPAQKHFAQHYHYGEVDYVAANMQPMSKKHPLVPAAAHLMTGISHTWQTADPQDSTQGSTKNPNKTTSKTQRYRTWAYDEYGRGILSVHGYPKQLDKNGKRKPNTGIQQVKVKYQQHNKPRINRYNEIGQTIITNSLGQDTTYTYTLIAGEYRLLSIVGAGCRECSTPNIVYGYDKLARLTHITQVRHQAATADKKAHLVPLHTQQTEYDQVGRTKRIADIAYIDGKAQTPQLRVRYEYPSIPTLPKKNAINAVHETRRVESQPSLIAKPSVIKGKEHQWRIVYNDHGQPLTVTETGYRPALPTDNSKQATKISRTLTYQYKTINNRSLLASVDGPLPNGKNNSPADSDITQYQYDKRGQYLTQIMAPNRVMTKLEYDLAGLAEKSAATGGTGRLVKAIANNGIATQYNYNVLGKVTATKRYPASYKVAEAKAKGLLQTTAMAYDDFGNTTMVKRADGQTIHMQYGFDGKLVSVNDGLGNRVEWKGWHKGKQDPSQSVTTQQWFTAEAPDTVARAWYFWRDDQNRLTQRLSPSGGLDTWQYSDTQQVADVGQTTAQASQWVQHIDPLNRMTLNAVGSQGSAQIRMTPTGYIHANFTSQTSLETTSKPTTKKPMQIVDDFGRVIQFSSAQHGTHTAQYNAANRITQTQQADGTRITYTYDVAGRPITKTAHAVKSKTTDVVSYSYNAFGLSQVKDSAQTVTYSQDLLGREIDKATTLSLNNGNTKTYHIRTRYTASGHVKAKQLIDSDWLVFSLDEQTGLAQAMTRHSTIWPSLTNKLASWFNLPDLPLQIATKTAIVSDIKAHPFNGITHLTHGNGLSDDYGFDLAGRLTTVSHGNKVQSSKANSPFIKASYSYDAGRRLTSEKIDTATLQGKVKEYAYTGWNDFATPPKAGFMHAVARKENVSASNKTPKVTPAKLDQAGRTIQDANYQYSYNIWGKLDAVKANKKTIATYQSNALGERVMANYSSAEGKQTRYYLYDKQKRVAELDESGHVIQQFLYLNESPVAVINSPTVSSETNQAGIVAIHTDRRHAPMMATDAQGEVIWQAEYDAWGKLIQANHEQKSNAKQGSQFNMNLRLPGQWQDAATGLYYNYQRDYNPDTGRYLTPDPLGFPDGPDAYAYVGYDPLNKVDPLGLYGIDVHYYMTYFLALVAGIPEEQARVMALATQYIDDNTTVTSPFAGNFALESYHFTLNYDNGFTGDSNNNLFKRINQPTSPQLYRLEYSAYKQSSICAKTQLFGEYLHAFEDTFAHRDKFNVPYQIESNPANNPQRGTGHVDLFPNPWAEENHQPDHTYNQYASTRDSFGTVDSNNPVSRHNVNQWAFNEFRTLQMEKEVFSKVREFAVKSGYLQSTDDYYFHEWADLAGDGTARIGLPGNKGGVDSEGKLIFEYKEGNTSSVLQQFNSYNEEADGNSLEGKVQILNDWLVENAFSPIPVYDEGVAAENRERNLSGLVQSDVPGVILEFELTNLVR